MIEVTPELIEVGQAATCRAESDECMAAALTAAFAFVERDRPDPAEALRAAYWKLRGHASSYRGTDIFRRRQEFFRLDPDNAVAARGAARDEWYARGIEAAAADFAELLELEYDATVGRDPGDTSP